MTRGLDLFGPSVLMPDTLSQNGVWGGNLKWRLFLCVVPKIKDNTFYDVKKLQKIKIEVFFNFKFIEFVAKKFSLLLVFSSN